MKFHTAASGGFTLVEAIIAIAILSGAMTGPLFLAYQGIKVSRDSKQELIAAHLAAEALEIVYSKRNNILARSSSANEVNWIAPVVTRCGASGCVIDVADTAVNGPNDVWRDNAFVQCAGGAACTNATVYLHTTNKLYRQSPPGASPQWAPTQFRRILKVNYIDRTSGVITAVQTDQVRAVSTVFFTRSNGEVGKVELTADLYNWFPQL